MRSNGKQTAREDKPGDKKDENRKGTNKQEEK